MRPPLAGIARNLLELVRVYRGEAPRPAGSGARVAVVLGAQVLPGGRASKTLQARVRHAARLHAEGRVSLLVPTGGLGEHPPTEAEVMVRILREEGVPEGVILPEERALNTWDSARYVARMMRERGVREVLVVTDPLHCARTVAAFEAAGLRPQAEPVYSSPMWRNRWMRLGQFAREIGATVWYGTRHGIGSPSRR